MVGDLGKTKYSNDELFDLAIRLDGYLEKQIKAKPFLRIETNILALWPLIRNLALTACASDYLPPVAFFFTSPQDITLSASQEIGRILLRLSLDAESCAMICERDSNFVLAYSAEMSESDVLLPKYWDSFLRLSLERNWDVSVLHFLPKDTPSITCNGNDFGSKSAGDAYEQAITLFGEAIFELLGIHIQKELTTRLIGHVLLGAVSAIRRILSFSKLPFMMVVDNYTEPLPYSLLLAARLINAKAAEVIHGSIYDHKYVMSPYLSACAYISDPRSIWLNNVVVSDSIQPRIASRLEDEGLILPSIIRPESHQAASMARDTLSQGCSGKGPWEMRKVIYLDTYAAGDQCSNHSPSSSLIRSLREEARTLMKMAKLYPHLQITVRPHPRWGINPILEDIINSNNDSECRIHVTDSNSSNLIKQLKSSELAIVSPRSSSWKECYKARCQFIFSYRTRLSSLIMGERLYRSDIERDILSANVNDIFKKPVKFPPAS